MIYHTLPLQAECSHWCKSYKAKVEDLIYLCEMLLENSVHYEELRNINKNEQLPMLDLHVGQNVMFQDATSRQWYPATITSLCSEPRSYNIITRWYYLQKDTCNLNPYTPVNGYNYRLQQDMKD